jgi:hypothetical protein
MVFSYKNCCPDTLHRYTDRMRLDTGKISHVHGGCTRSDHALLVSHHGVVDHVGNGGHGRPESGVILQALYRDSPKLQTGHGQIDG